MTPLGLAVTDDQEILKGSVTLAPLAGPTMVGAGTRVGSITSGRVGSCPTTSKP